jgi:hypothetical protein
MVTNEENTHEIILQCLNEAGLQVDREKLATRITHCLAEVELISEDEDPYAYSCGPDCEVCC